VHACLQEEEEEGGDVNALADSLAGLSVKPIRVAQPQGLLKGVVAPAGGTRGAEPKAARTQAVRCSNNCSSAAALMSKLLPAVVGFRVGLDKIR
jgi:hypothetical protein